MNRFVCTLIIPTLFLAHLGAALAEQEFNAIRATNDQAAEQLQQTNEHIQQARQYRSAGDYDQALQAVSQAESTATQHGSLSLQAQVRYTRGTIYAEQGNLGAALEAFLLARDELAEQNDHAAHARVVMGIAITYMRAEDYEGALVFLRETEDLVRTHQLNNIRPYLLNNLAIAIENTAGEEASLPIYQEALEIAREQEDLPTVGRLQALICRPLIELEQLDAAEVACMEAYELLPDTASTRFNAGVRVNLAHLAIAQAQPEQAENWLREALDMVGDRFPTVERDALRLWVELQEASGDYQAALQGHQRLRELEMNLLDVERQEQVEQLSMRRQLERSAREIEVLNLEQELAGVRLKRQRWLIWGSISALILVALLAVYVWQFFQAKARREEELAAHDPLTGLLNRRGFESVLRARQHKNANTSEQAEIVLMADLDHFKQINDQYGHLVGDEVLVAVAERLQTQVRGIDAVVRWGGEEFLIYLPTVNEQEYRRIARRLLDSVSGSPIATASGSLHVRMTIGLARVSTSVKGAIQAADNALRRGKESGRNQIIEAR